MIRNYIKKYEGYSIFISVLMIILGLILVINPIKSLEVIVIAFSIIMIINGISSFITYFTTSKEDRLFSLDLIIGMSTILYGILVFIFRLDLINILPIVLGVWIIISNLFKLQLSINLISVEGSGFIGLVLISILMIILGVVLIINPFGSSIVITQLAGILLLITEVINLIESIYVLIKIK